LKKITYLLVVSVLLVTLFSIVASANYLADENFENTTTAALKAKYRLAGETTGMKYQIVSGGQANSKALLLTNRPAHWAGFRIPAWTEKVPDDMSPSTIGKYANKTGTQIIDFNKNYTLDFFVKFVGDINKVSVQFCWYYDDGTYGYIELFFTEDVGESWTNMYSTFKLADEFRAATGLKENVTKMPKYAEISIIAAESSADMYLDNVMLAEGRTLPSKTTSSTGGTSRINSTTSSKAPGASTASVAASNAPDASTAVSAANNSGLDVSLAAQSTDNFFDDDDDASIAKDDGENNDGGFPVWIIAVIAAGVIVLGAGACLLYIKVIKK